MKSNLALQKILPFFLYRLLFCCLVQSTDVQRVYVFCIVHRNLDNHFLSCDLACIIIFFFLQKRTCTVMNMGVICPASHQNLRKIWSLYPRPLWELIPLQRNSKWLWRGLVVVPLMMSWQPAQPTVGVIPARLARTPPCSPPPPHPPLPLYFPLVESVGRKPQDSTMVLTLVKHAK